MIQKKEENGEKYVLDGNQAVPFARHALFSHGPRIESGENILTGARVQRRGRAGKKGICGWGLDDRAMGSREL